MASWYNLIGWWSPESLIYCGCVSMWRTLSKRRARRLHETVLMSLFWALKTKFQLLTFFHSVAIVASIKLCYFASLVCPNYSCFESWTAPSSLSFIHRYYFDSESDLWTPARVVCLNWGWSNGYVGCCGTVFGPLVWCTLRAEIC